MKLERDNERKYEIAILSERDIVSVERARLNIVYIASWHVLALSVLILMK